MKIHIKIYPWMRTLQSWFQRMKAWETPSWWPSFLKTDRTEPLVVTPAQYKKLVRACAVAVVVIVIAAGIGIYEFVSLQQTKAQEALHEQQLELMREKTTSLQEKMDKMDSLDQELRQMVKGSGAGDSPKGDGGVAGGQKKSPDLSHASYNDLLLATSRLETRSNARIISFITLKTVLSDTAGEQVRQMQQITHKYQGGALAGGQGGDASSTSTTPSIWPVSGTITSNFGYRGNPIGGGSGFHEGTMILGPLMRMLYQMIPNFAVTMIVFTVIIKLLMLPLMIKQQKSMAKMSVFTPMINEIQQKYKNNQEKMQEEMVKFQQEYGYSPTAGCLPMLINMLVLFGMVEVVYRPVQYILGIPKEAISAACTALGIANNGAASQTGLIEAIHAGLASGVDTGLATEQLSSIANFNTSFLGMDMCTIPGFSFSLIMIFPIIAAVTMCISQVLSTKMSGQQAQMQGSMKVMMWGMNIMFVFMCFQMPVGFSLYYGTSNIFMMLQTVLTYKVYNPEKFKAQYEAEVAAKRAAKKEVKTVTVEEGGKKVEKNVNKRQLDQMRLEYARKLDAEKYANDRTVPLTDEQRAEMEAQKAQKGKKKK